MKIKMTKDSYFMSCFIKIKTIIISQLLWQNTFLLLTKVWWLLKSNRNSKNVHSSFIDVSFYDRISLITFIALGGFLAPFFNHWRICSSMRCWRTRDVRPTEVLHSHSIRWMQPSISLSSVPSSKDNTPAPSSWDHASAPSCWDHACA